MLLFGDRVSYASHLPMFHNPHNDQLILKLQLSDVPSRSTQTPPLMAYTEAKARGETLFTLEPELMDLSQVMQGSRTFFAANLYEGHFERGGTLLGSIRVRVEKIVFSARLDAAQTPPNFEEYFFFGEGPEFFGAHKIVSKPSFDAIFSVNTPGALPIEVPQLLRKPKNELPKEGFHLGGERGVLVDKVIYTEFDDLS